MKKFLLSFLFLLACTLTIKASFVVNVPNSSICPGSCTTLTATPGGGMGPYTYSWTPLAMTGPSINACPVTTTTYTVVVTDMMGATGSAVATVTVDPQPVITCADAGICPGNAITLTATGAVSYTWSPLYGLNSGTGATVTARPAYTTNYKITGANTFGCTNTTTVLVTVFPKPIAAFTTSPSSVNASNPTVYFTDQSTGGTATAWFWSFGDINNTTSTLQNPSFTYPNAVNCYQPKLIVTNQFGCPDSVESSLCITGIEERVHANGSIKVYPNPFADKTTITILSDQQNGNYSFELYDVLGRQVRSINEISTKQFEVSRNGLSTGIYFYKIVDTENLVGTGKIVIK